MISYDFLYLILIIFIAEYTDSTLGMGYGTILTPILLLLGFDALDIVPCVLISEIFTGLFAYFMHYKAGNFNFRISGSFTRHLKIISLLTSFGLIGTILGVLTAITISKFFLNLYIGIMILSVGIFILISINKTYDFSTKKIMLLGAISAFNKGISGGGYGPLVTGGQLLAGVDSKEAISITSFSEAFICITGIILYVAGGKQINLNLCLTMIVGASLAVPFSVYSVKLIKDKSLKLAIGILTVFLGLLTLIKLF